MNKKIAQSSFWTAIAFSGVLISADSFALNSVDALKKKTAAKPSKTSKTVGQLLDIENTKAQAQIPAFSEKLFQSRGSARPVDLDRVKPPKNSQFISQDNSDKAKLEKLLDQQIDELFKMTEKFKGSARRGELWLRLAEVYVEKASLIDFKKQTEYDQALKEFFAGRRKTKPKLDSQSILEYNKKAIQLYEWFLRDFPRDEKVDQALFFLGYNYYELGQTKAGTHFYTRLTKEFPRSQYVLESYFALGEFFFENEKWKQAAASFQRVLNDKGHRLYHYSLYKLAWCSFRTSQSQKAMQQLQSLISSLRQAPKNSSNPRLESEALKDLVLVYTEIGQPQKAIQYFRSVAPQDSDFYLERLAYLYADRGERSGAQQLFAYLIAQNPNQPKAFEYQYQIVKSFSNAVKTQEFKKELLSWIRDYSADSAWYKANSGNKDLVQNALALRETNLRIWILQQHQSAQKTKSLSAQKLAADGYSIYLSEFRNAPLYPDMLFYFAELQYDRGQNKEAADNYRLFADQYPQHKFAGNSAENVVLSLEKSLPKDAEIEKKVGQRLQPVAMSEAIRKFIDSGLWYNQKYPQKNKRVEIEFRIGRLYYQHNYFDEAIPYFKKIIEKNSGTVYAEYSANLLLDIFNLKKDYAGLEKVAKELLQIPSFKASKAGKEVQAILGQVGLKKIQEFERNKDYPQAAQSFEAFALANSGSPQAAGAFLNAAVNYEKAGERSKALKNYDKCLAQKPSEEIRYKALVGSAQIEQDRGNLEGAVHLYEQAAKGKVAAGMSSSAHFNAGVLAEALGQLQRASGNYAQSRGADSLWQTAELKRKSNADTAAAKAYKDFLSFGKIPEDKRLEAQFQLYQLARAKNNQKEVSHWKKQFLQSFQASTQKNLYLNHRAALQLDEARDLLAVFRSLKIPKTQARQQKVVQEKIKALNQLNQKLLSVIKMDSSPQIVSSLYLLGQANHNMAETLIQATRPAGMSEVDKKKYEDSLAAIVDPFYKKAQESYQACVDRGSDLETYGEDYHRAKDQVARLNPKHIDYSKHGVIESYQVQWMGL